MEGSEDPKLQGQEDGPLHADQPNMEGPSEESAQAARRRKKRWGQETEAGKKVLEAVTGGQNEPAGASGGQQQAEPPPAKKKKSRWEQGDDAVEVPGMPGISLPAHLVHLVDVSAETMELQKQLTSVSGAPLLL